MSSTPDALGVFRPRDSAPRVGARAGDQVIDLAALAPELDVPSEVLAAPSLNRLMALGLEAWRSVIAQAADLAHSGRADGATRPAAEVDLLLPIEVADYVDFFSSIDHATNLGHILWPGDEPLPPNWRELPVGYHGRSATVVASGTPIRRPRGQVMPAGGRRPVYAPSERLDIELELGAIIGAPSTPGMPVTVDEALDHVFGLVLLNDWSARDLQAWESRPLGPLLGKSFGTSISPWVVPLDAVAPARVTLPAQEPEPLDYLRGAVWTYDLDLEIELNGEVVTRSNARHLYWSIEQQIAHLTANGARLRTGDLLGSGTISGPEASQRGSMLERSWNGMEPLQLADGTERSFLADGDEVVLRGRTSDVELGEVRGRILPAW